MMLQILVIVFAATICTLSIFFYYESRSYAINEAQKKIKNLLLENQALNNYVTKDQKPAIAKIKQEGKLYSEYFAPEILSGSYIVKNMHKYYNELRKKDGLDEVYFKIAANNPRNTENKSDDFEQGILKKFNEGGISEYKEVVAKDGQSFLYYALPFARNTQDCMVCHSTPDKAPKDLVARYGDKNGFGEKVGDIRAIISIRAPLAQEIQQANKTFFMIGMMVFGLLFMLFAGGGWMLMRAVSKPINHALEGLGGVANQLASAVDNLSSSSHYLADGTSQQAASIEQTSSSLEEMSSMTLQNAKNADQANQLMQETSRVVSIASRFHGAAYFPHGADLSGI